MLTTVRNMEIHYVHLPQVPNLGFKSYSIGTRVWPWSSLYWRNCANICSQRTFRFDSTIFLVADDSLDDSLDDPSVLVTDAEQSFLTRRKDWVKTVEHDVCSLLADDIMTIEGILRILHRKAFWAPYRCKGKDERAFIIRSDRYSIKWKT